MIDAIDMLCWMLFQQNELDRVSNGEMREKRAGRGIGSTNGWNNPTHQGQLEPFPKGAGAAMIGWLKER